METLWKTYYKSQVSYCLYLSDEMQAFVMDKLRLGHSWYLITHMKPF